MPDGIIQTEDTNRYRSFYQRCLSEGDYAGALFSYLWLERHGALADGALDPRSGFDRLERLRQMVELRDAGHAETEARWFEAKWPAYRTDERSVIEAQINGRLRLLEEISLALQAWELDRASELTDTLSASAPCAADVERIRSEIEIRRVVAEARASLQADGTAQGAIKQQHSLSQRLRQMVPLAEMLYPEGVAEMTSLLERLDRSVRDAWGKQILSYVGRDQFDEAARVMAAARDSFPDDARFADWERRLDGRRVEQYRTVMAEAASLAERRAWRLARQAAQRARRVFPQSMQCRELVSKLQLESDRFDDFEREAGALLSLYAQERASHRYRSAWLASRDLSRLLRSERARELLEADRANTYRKDDLARSAWRIWVLGILLALLVAGGALLGYAAVRLIHLARDTQISPSVAKAVTSTASAMQWASATESTRTPVMLDASMHATATARALGFARVHETQTASAVAAQDALSRTAHAAHVQAAQTAQAETTATAGAWATASALTQTAQTVHVRAAQTAHVQATQAARTRATQTELARATSRAQAQAAQTAHVQAAQTAHVQQTLTAVARLTEAAQAQAAQTARERSKDATAEAAEAAAMASLARTFYLDHPKERGGATSTSVKGQVWDKAGVLLNNGRATVKILCDGWDPAGPNMRNPAPTNGDGWYEFYVGHGQKIEIVEVRVDGRLVQLEGGDQFWRAKSKMWWHVDIRER